MEQEKIYPTKTVCFDSFTDLKQNVALFASRVPCTLETLGYREKGDGGAATYQILSEKPSGIFEKLGSNCWAVIVATDEVKPQQFGAYADGKQDDTTALLRAIAYASERSITLTLTEADYRTEYPLTLGNVKVSSQNARISYHGLAMNTAAVYVESHTEIKGTLNIWSADNGAQNHGERCALMFGHYEKETSVTDCHIERVIVTGGTKHTNAVFITGNSYDITIDRIEVPEGTFVNRALLIHWGNASSYTVTQDPPVYTQKPNGTPTQHPHDIHIGTIECHGLKKFDGLADGDSSAVSICGAYDIYVHEIIASDVCRAVNLTGADVGFYFASEEERELTARNICIDQISATDVHESAIYLLGTAGYAPFAETWPELHIKKLYAQASATGTRGLNCHAAGLIEIETCTLVGFGDRAVSLAYGCKQVRIDTLNVTDCKGWTIHCSTKTGKSQNSDILIDRLNVSNTEDNAASAISLTDTNDFTVNEVRMSGGSYASLLVLGNGVKQVKIGSLQTEKPLRTSVIHAEVGISSEHGIKLGTMPSGIPLTSGKSCMVSRL